MKRHRPAIGFVLVTLFLDILGIGLLIPILPRLVESFTGGNVSNASTIYGVLAALYSLMQFIFAPALGSLSDRFGRRPVILASLLCSGLDYLLMAFAPTLAWFFVARIVAGITGANLSLAIVGLMAAIVQGGLVRTVIPRLGERRAIIIGFCISAVAFIGYGLATQGWMIYAILVFGSFGMITGPASQGLISKTVGVDEQGTVQGALSSLSSVSGIVGPPVAASLFGYFIGPSAPIHLPGAAFFLGSFLIVCALLLALRSFRRHPTPGNPLTSGSGKASTDS